MRNPPPELPHPDEVRAALTSAQNHATDEVLTLKRKQRTWILVGVGAYVFTLIGLGVALGFLYKQSGQIVDQGNKIVDLQNSAADNSANGRTLLAKVLDLNQRIIDFTDPNSQTSKDQQAKTADILAQLDAAQRTGRADQLKKIAQMFEQCRSPCDPAIINRILAQPVPVPRFGAASPARPALSTASSSGAAAVATKTPSPSPRAVSCKGPIAIQATPLVLPVLPPTQVQVCIPASPTP